MPINDSWQPDTGAIRRQQARSNFREHSQPLYLTSSFVFDSAEQARDTFAGEEEGLVYSRYGNPNTDELIDKLCFLEGTEDGLATASGMAAMFGALASLLKQGDHLVASRALFGSTHQIITRILPRWGIDFTYVDSSDPKEWEKALRPETKMLFIETPSNPCLEILDIGALAELAGSRGILLAVDNCFATPVLQNPAVLGADIVLHSATKFLDGQGRVLGGAILGQRETIDEIRFFTRQTGPALSPFNAWILSKSLETLSLRMDRHCDNARQTAEFLESRRGVGRVLYPGLPSHPGFSLAEKQMKKGGALVSFELPGGSQGAMKFLNNLKMISLTSNLGDSRSIATHPATTTHAKLSPEERAASGISDGLVRLSLGLEDSRDILNDIDQALEAAAES